MKHALFSASGAERWANCPGSLALCAGLKSYDNEYSLEGTAGHTLSERCLNDGTDPEQYIGEVFLLDANFGRGPVKHAVEITDDLARTAQSYVDYVRGISGLRLVETRADYSALLGLDAEEGFGTSDTVILADTTVHVIDLKCGRGYVDPEDNKQLTLYAAGVVDAMEAIGEEITDIHLHIVQPRVSGKPEVFYLTREQLAAAVIALREAAQEATGATLTFAPKDRTWEDRYLRPGPKQCQWCPAAAACPALRTRAQSVTPIEEFDPVNALDAKSAADLSEDMTRIPLLELWVKAIEAETQRRLTRGDKVPGWKMVVGREGNRKWTDEEAVKTAFGNDPILYKPATLKTAPQLEKELKKDPRRELIPPLVSRAPARPTMTVESDPREPWVESADADEFGVVE